MPVLLLRSIDFVAALLGVLKAGAAYAAIDPSWPADYLSTLLAMLPSPVLIGPESADGGPADGRLVWSPADVRGGLAVPDVVVAGSDPCCVFFSSGTTGQPKGALVPHDGTVLLFRDASFASLGPGTAMPQAAPLPWDGLTLELWSMLSTGGTALLAEQAPLTAAALRAAVRCGATLVWTTTSVFNLFVEEDLDCFAGLSQVLVGGERLSPPHIKEFLRRHGGRIRLTNGYGPVEATVFVTTHDIRLADCDDEHGIPIGTALPHTDVHVLDGDQRCDDGQVGELCVAGRRLGLGYLGQIQGGFTELRLDGDDGEVTRLYRTGDRVVRRDGVLHFVGRGDRQVKIRGNRVEPQQVEAAAMRLPGMTRCVVLPLGRSAGTPLGGSAGMPPGGSAGLILCYLAAGGSGLSERVVADRLGEVLPGYAVPDRIYRVDEFPLTVNGKLDQQALLASADRGWCRPGGGRAGEGAGAGATEVERRVAALIGVVLGTGDVPVDASAIPVDVGVAELGVTSLDMIRVGMRLERAFGVRMPIDRLQRNPDVRAIAALVTEAVESAGTGPAGTGPAGAGPAGGRVPVGVGGPVPMASFAASFLVRSMIAPQDTSSLCPMLWDVSGPLDVAALNAALLDVAHRHDALSAAYQIQKAPVAVPGRPIGPIMRVLSPATDLAEARELVLSSLCAEPLALDRGQVWRAALAPVPGDLGRAGPERAGLEPAGPELAHVLGVVVHHLAFDGWSEGVLARDLAICYNARLAGQPPRFAWPAGAMTVCASPGAAEEASLRYWKSRLTGAANLRFTDRPPGGEVHATKAAHVGPRHLAAVAVDRWAAFAGEQGTTVFVALLTVFARCLGRLAAEPDVIIGVPVVIRQAADEDAAIGCLINMVGLRLNDAEGNGWDAAVRRAADEFGSAYAHRFVGFPDVVKLLAPPRTDTTPLFQAICVLQDSAPPKLDLEGCGSTFHRRYPPDALSQIVAEFYPADRGGLLMDLAYQVRHVSPKTALRLADDLIGTLVAGPTAPY